MHTPMYGAGKDTAVVFIHGFMGSPGQFADLAAAVHDLGFAYKSILLPGHGGTLRNFIQSRAEDWQRHVQEEIDNIKATHGRIYLVGHSMGGLLALNAANLDGISGIMLLSTPLKVYWLNPKASWAKLRLLTLPKEHEVKQTYTASNSVVASRVFFYPLAAKPLMQLYKLMRQTKKRLPDVRIPVYMFHSRRDETTAYKSAAILGKKLPQSTAFQLENSWHAHYCKDEREKIKTCLLEMIRGA